MWKVFVLASMGVDIPVDAVGSILKSQVDWEKDRVKRSTPDEHYKRCAVA